MRLIGPIVKNEVILIVSLLALPLIFLLVPGRAERQRATDAAALEGPERRLAQARLRRERGWRTMFAAAGIVVIVSLGVSWAFTRLPQLIDPPTLVAAGGGEVRIPKTGLDDGHLHRFGVPIDGTVVRFFVMKAGDKLIPSFDACAVCGAYGYLETKGRLVCMACAADVNTATISSLKKSVPRPELPKTILPVAWRTSSGLSVKSPAPRTDCAAIVVITKIATRMNVDSTPASPGVVLAFSDSSLTLAAVSQPQ